MTVEKWARLNALPCCSAELTSRWATMQRVEYDLLEEGVKPFPISQAGLSAYHLWNLIIQRLLRGVLLELTLTELKLPWHRQKLKRARDELLDMGLIRQTDDGRYVLGRYSRMDDLTREELLNVHLMREVNLILGSLMPKSKTQKARRSSPRHKRRENRSKRLSKESPRHD
jgi:hypothetical protein